MMIATLILSAALAHGTVIHYEHDYQDVTTCESAFSIAKRQMQDVGARTVRGECLTEQIVERRPSHQIRKHSHVGSHR
jgi:hypothetical protein